jgi:PAT family beta-lactamase induction signal transducer AmpG
MKFLWGPLVDEYSTKRRWLLAMQTVLAVILVLAALVIPLADSVQWIAALFFIGSFIAATHDIAIDGYYMEALDKDGQAKFVGYRTMAYRIAMITGTAGIVWIGTNIKNIGWLLAFWTAAVIFGLFLVYHFFFLPEVQSPQKRIPALFKKLFRVKPVLFMTGTAVLVLAVRFFFQSDFYGNLKEQAPILKKIGFSHWVLLLLFSGLALIGIFLPKIKAFILRDPDSYYSKAFVLFMDQEKVVVILAFIIMLRTGEWTVSTMVSPFIVDVGIDKHYAFISGWVGIPASILGAMWGGWMISRFSLKKVMWPFILAQNFTNVIYMALAIHLASFIKINTGAQEPVAIGIFNLVLVALTHGFDQFAGGLGTAVLMTFLMRICHKEYKAAHYAIGSALMNTGGLFFGALSGFITSWLGYAWLFGISFVVSIPAMLLIPFLPNLADGEKRVAKKF